MPILLKVGNVLIRPIEGCRKDDPFGMAAFAERTRRSNEKHKAKMKLVDEIREKGYQNKDPYHTWFQTDYLD